MYDILLLMNNKEQDVNIVASDTAKQKIGGAKQKLVRRSSKYSWLLKSVKIFDGGSSTPGGRGCTNGKDAMWINAEMSEEEMIAVIAHEAKHIERGDCDEAREDFDLWNYYSDAEINEELANEGIHVPNGVRVAGALSIGAEKLYRNALLQKKGLSLAEEPIYGQAV